MLEKFLNKTKFDSYEDFMQNFKVNVPENFNFGYDVVDEWARTNPDKPALLWTNEQGEKIQFTFADIKHKSDQSDNFTKCERDFLGMWLSGSVHAKDCCAGRYYPRRDIQAFFRKGRNVRRDIRRERK